MKDRIEHPDFKHEKKNKKTNEWTSLKKGNILKQICSNLEEQYQEFDDLVSGLDAKLWQHRTPFYNWTIFDQVAHIAFFDHEALLAIQYPDRFRERAEGVVDVIVSGQNLRAYTNSLLDFKLLDYNNSFKTSATSFPETCPLNFPIKSPI